MWAQVEAGVVVAATRSTLQPDPSWLPVTETDRPADTPATTWDQRMSVVGGLPVLGWVERPKTAAELAAESPEVKAALLGLANASTLRAQAAAALTSNQGFLAIATPTATQVRVQTQALTRQVNAVVRLALGLLDSTN